MSRFVPRAVGSLHRSAPSITSRSSPYVCTHCQARIASRNQQPRTSPTHRTITTSRTARQRQQPPQSHFDFFPQTYPQGPPPRAAFTPNLQQLHKEFLQLQAKAHPDLAAPTQKRHAEALSARINEAYQTLQNPLKRAQYLLSQHGIDVEDDSAKLSAGENSLLTEVMEAREAVDEAEREEELVELRAENSERIERSVGALEEAFARGELEKAAREAVKLRYWMNIEESIEGWEEGRGGGVIHH